jgi:hypothetical protein
MRKYLLLLAASVMMAACVTLTPEEKAQLSKAVNIALDERHYTIDIQTMTPNRGATKNVASNWSLEVKGDTLISYLPYMGRAYQIPYGGGKGLNFTAPIKTYHESKGKKDERRIVIEVDNENDTHTYSLVVFDNGRADLDVQSKEREFISYSGEMMMKRK